MVYTPCYFLVWRAQKRQGLLNLEPEYQRGFVWDKTASSRLVETILLGLPVPEVLLRPLIASACISELPKWPRLPDTSKEVQCTPAASPTCMRQARSAGHARGATVGLQKALSDGRAAAGQVWVHEQGDGRLDIVDGKQRITSLLSFLDGTFPRNGARFTLEGLETLEQLNGRAREDLTDREQQSLQEYPLSLRILGQGSGVPSSP